MEEQLRRDALEYHRVPTFGKISVTPTKSLVNQRDLALAYSPGVAYACLAIRDDPNEAATLTSRANLVAVITNGTAVLGLGNIGALAGKPVMEGKACLFKKFAGIDVFDIEINERDPDKLVEIVASLEPTFGGINLEDIKAPECFYIERALRERMKIPVFHDDQHGTAIIAAAAVLNGLKLVGKDIREVKLACSGAGAAAIACLDQLVSLGLRMENILVTDAKGVVYEGRAEGMDPIKARYARPTSARTLGDIIDGSRYLPRAFGRRGAEAGYGQAHGEGPTDLGAGQPDAGNQSGRRQGRPSRRDHSDRPFGLSQSSEQRPVFSIPVSRCARRRCNDDQRRNEVRGRAGHRRIGACRAIRRCRDRLWGSTSGVRAQLPDTDALRSAPHRANCSSRCQGSHGQRRRHPTARRFRSLSPAHGALHVSVRLQHGAGVRRSENGAEAGSLRGGRGRSGFACGASHRGRGPRETGARWA